MYVSGRKIGDSYILKQSDSEEFSNLNCLPCRDNKQLNITAYGFCKTCSDSLCYTCFNHHTTPRLYKDHVLQQISCSESEAFTNKCPTHQELIQFYCSSHNHYGCAICFATDHRACTCVVYVEEEYQKLKNQFDQLDAQINQNSETARKNKVKASELYQEAKDNQVKFKQKIAEFLKANDTEEIKEAQVQKIEDQNKMENVLETYETIKNTVQDLKQSAQVLYNNKQTCELLKLTEEIGNQVKDSETTILKLEKDNKIAKYKFEPTKQLQEVLDNVTTLGEIVYEDQERCAQNDVREQFNGRTCIIRCGQWLWIIFKLLMFSILYILWIALGCDSKNEHRMQEGFFMKTDILI